MGTMKRIMLLTCAFVLFATLAACGPKAELNVDSDGASVKATATNGASGSGTASVTIKDGEGGGAMVISHQVERGSFQVTITSSSGAVVFDKEIEDNIADIVDATGDFDVKVEAKNAVGTAEIITGDKEALDASEATMPAEVREMLESSSEASGSSK